MKQNLFLRWAAICSVLLLIPCFMASCAKTRIPPIPQTHEPPRRVPEIGAPPPGKTMEQPVQPQPERPSPPAPQKEPRPAILNTLIRKAEKELLLRKPDIAFQTLERALAIDGRDPEVWHLMAKSRLMNGQYRQAESLARKSNTLAGDDRSLKKENWKIIIRSLEEQGRVEEADQARRAVDGV
ncbi:MAG: hypothetical protein RBQ72_01130 [Desulfobacterium sp.]|nr:hypothetical protein [Desulfobacterium sp.]